MCTDYISWSVDVRLVVLNISQNPMGDMWHSRNYPILRAKNMSLKNYDLSEKLFGVNIFKSYYIVYFICLKKNYI